jgi:putative ABC transport system permease protein
MGVLFKIALRNLREHKTKTVIIGSIIALGLMILVVGNALLDTAEAGIRSMYTQNFTGQVMIAGINNDNPSLFLNPGSINDDASPRIQDYQELAGYLDGLPWVTGRVSQITGLATAQVDGQGRAFLQLFGVDPQTYLEMFPDSIDLIAGSFLEPEQTGVVLSRDVVDMLEDSSGRTVDIGDTILLTNMNVRSGTKIREVEVRGIHRFRSEAPNLSYISFLDLRSLRALTGMTLVTDVAADLTEQEQDSLGAVDENALFGAAGNLFSGDRLEAGEGTAEEGTAEGLFDILGDTSGLDLYRRLDPDAWHYVLLHLEDGRSVERSIQALNRDFESLGLPVRAYDWVQAAGGIAQLVAGLRLVFNTLIIIVAVVAVIIIMNTLVISITERIGEIGTMRAIGARRSFVRRMITLETLIISVVFGVLGILLGSGVVGILHATGIEASSMFLQVLFGGPELLPVLKAGTLTNSLFIVIGVGIVSALYPVSVALRIEPVQAMSRR